ncbi:unnamed protein product [Cochlearia groenlandica]
MATNTTSKLFFLTLMITILLLTEARNLQTTTTAETADHSGAGNLMDCWNAALELKSCTEEIVKFFLSRNGTTEPGVYGGIDKDCCGAVGLIVKDCWAVMFTTLGLTTMQANNLVEYCDFLAEKTEELSPSPSPASETSYLSPGFDYYV